MASEFAKVAPSLSKQAMSAASGIKLRVIEVELPWLESSESETLPLLLGRLLS